MPPPPQTHQRRGSRSSRPGQEQRQRQRFPSLGLPPPCSHPAGAPDTGSSASQAPTGCGHASIPHLSPGVLAPRILLTHSVTQGRLPWAQESREEHCWDRDRATSTVFAQSSSSGGCRMATAWEPQMGRVRSSHLEESERRGQRQHRHGATGTRLPGATATGQGKRGTRAELQSPSRQSWGTAPSKTGSAQRRLRTTSTASRHPTHTAASAAATHR